MLEYFLEHFKTDKFLSEEAIPDLVIGKRIVQTKHRHILEQDTESKRNNQHGIQLPVLSDVIEQTFAFSAHVH